MIYLASPYLDSDPDVMKMRYEMVCEACVGLVKKDLTVYSPIAHWHPIALKYDLRKDFAFWKSLDHEMVFCCSRFWVLQLNGWNTSVGVKDEIAYAKQSGRDVKYVTLSECL